MSDYTTHVMPPQLRSPNHQKVGASSALRPLCTFHRCCRGAVIGTQKLDVHICGHGDEGQGFGHSVGSDNFARRDGGDGGEMGLGFEGRVCGLGQNFAGISVAMAEMRQAESKMGAGEERAFMGITETVAAKSLEDASLPVNFHGNLASARSDQELLNLLQQAKNSKRPAIVNYGAPWCHACRQMMPTFCNLSNDHASALFIYADVNKCIETTQDVRYTPTFRFYRDGDKVDEFYGAGPQRLRDRVWLHT